MSKPNTLAIISILTPIILLVSCAKNTNPPDYIKDVVAYKEGSDGVVVYFVLADANGQMTTSAGTFDITITQTTTEYSDGDVHRVENELFSSRREARLSDYQSATVGMGAFEHKALLFPLGRIPYSNFRGPINENGSGSVSIKFQLDGGRVIEGSTTFPL